MHARVPSRIHLAADRRASLLAALQRHVDAEFDEVLSDFRGNQLIDFFLQRLGPPVYNQGVRDAVGFMQERLGDIEGEIHEPDEGR